MESWGGKPLQTPPQCKPYQKEDTRVLAGTLSFVVRADSHIKEDVYEAESSMAGGSDRTADAWHAAGRLRWLDYTDRCPDCRPGGRSSNRRAGRSCANCRAGRHRRARGYQ